MSDEVVEAIREWAAPDAELGWRGSVEVASHAQEIVDWLVERGLVKP